jgi:hypothetical protein
MSTITSEELQEIVDLANSVPEEYRQKCFELLLSNMLYQKQPTTIGGQKGFVGAGTPALQQDQVPFILPIDVRAFLSQYGLAESVIWKFFIKDGEEIRPIYQLKETRKAKTQIQHALMLSLENAITKGQFQVETEILRAHCVDQKCYDSSNFAANIQNNAKLFKSVASDQPLSLSPDGKSELAELLEQL